MAVDANIYGRFQPKSAVSYAGELEQLAGMREQRQDNALARAFNVQKMDAARAQAGRADALRQLQQSLAGKSEPEYVQGLRGAGYFDEAAGVEKDMLERDSKRATATKTAVDARGAVLGQYREALSAVNTPETARMWLQAQYQDPQVKDMLTRLAPMDQALAQIPTDPQQFMQWRDQQAMGIKAVQDAMMERDKLNKPAAPPASVAEYEFAKKQGYKGTLEQWVTSKAKAGATNVTMSTGQKGFENESKLRNDFRAEPVVKAFEDMREADKQIKAGVAQANPVGDMAAATKIMKLLDPGSVVRETELAMAMQATGKLDRLQNFAQMYISGEKLTPKQRQEFSALADDLMDAAGQAFNQKRAEYMELGGRYQLDTRALGTEWKSKKPPKPAAPAASGPKPTVSNW